MMISTAHGGHVLAGLVGPQTAVVAVPRSPCRPIPGHMPHHPAEVAASIAGAVSLIPGHPVFTTTPVSPALYPTLPAPHPNQLQSPQSNAAGDRYEGLKRLAMVQIHPPRNPNKPLTPFSIHDILSKQNCKSSDKDRSEREKERQAAVVERQRRHEHLSQLNLHAARAASLSAAGLAAHQAAVAAAAAAGLAGGGSIVRPWATAAPNSPAPSGSECSSELDEDQEIEVDDLAPSKPRTSGDKKSPLDALLHMTSKTFDGLDSQSKLDQGKKFKNIVLNTLSLFF